MWFFLFILKRRIRFFVWTSRQKKYIRKAILHDLIRFECISVEKVRMRYDIILRWNIVSRLSNEQQLLVLQPFVKIYGLIRLSHEIERLSLLAKWWSGACNVERDDRVKLSSGFVLFNSVSVRMLIDKFVTRAFDNEKFVSFALRYKIIGIDIFFLVYIITMQVVKV